MQKKILIGKEISSEWETLHEDPVSGVNVSLQFLSSTTAKKKKRKKKGRIKKKMECGFRAHMAFA